MRIYLRLNQYLRLDRKTPGEIRKLVKEIGITKFQLNHLINKDAPMIPRDVLSKVCNYLVEKKIADESELPGALFGRPPSRFWHLLCERERITMCMGVRRDQQFSDQVVIAADSVLQANLLFRMTQAASSDDDAESRRRRSRRGGRIPQIIDPRLVPTWDRKRGPYDRAIRREAAEFYDRFVQEGGDKAAVCFGSIKSNPVIEEVVAACFPKAKPFHSEDSVPQAADRNCPFLIAYRDHDPHPDSVCGGRRLYRDGKIAEAGVYYERPGGRWQRVPWDEKNADAALVLYRFQKPLGQLDMVMGGYSGRGTRCLAEYIRKTDREMTEFWPPTLSIDDVDIGAFVIKFSLQPRKRGADGRPGTFQEIKAAKVIRLREEVLEHRVAKPAQK